MTQNTANTNAFQEREIYDTLILEKLPSVLLPTDFFRNVTNFASGQTLFVKTVGDVTLQDITEDQQIAFNPIDTGEVTLTITEHVGAAFEITDELREDGNQIDQLIAANATLTTKAIGERFESDFMQAAFDGLTLGDPNNINGQPHMRRASGAGEQILEDDLALMKLAFDKADVPLSGRMLLVDPVTATSLDRLVTITDGLDRDPFFMRVREEGFLGPNMQFLGNIFGWNIISTNRLPDVAAGTNIDGTLSITAAGKANIFMSVVDDASKPVMGAFRRLPRTETERLINPPKDQFVTTTRYGFGVQRIETLGVIVSDAVATA